MMMAMIPNAMNIFLNLLFINELFIHKSICYSRIRRLRPVFSLQNLLVELQTKTLVGSSHIEEYQAEHGNLDSRIKPWKTYQNRDEQRDAAPVEGKDIGIFHQWKTARTEVGTQLLRQLLRISFAQISLEYLEDRSIPLLSQGIVLVEELEEFLHWLLLPLHLLPQIYLLAGIVQFATLLAFQEEEVNLTVVVGKTALNGMASETGNDAECPDFQPHSGIRRKEMAK